MVTFIALVKIIPPNTRTCISLYENYSCPSVCLSVCPSVTGGHRKRFDPEKQEAVSLAIEQQKLELGNLCDRHPWH